MKDKLLFLTIGLLIGIVVMQWGGGANESRVIQLAHADEVDPETDIAAFEAESILDRNVG